MIEYLDIYYDTVRRLLATGDPLMRLTHVGLGTSGAPDATELTEPHVVAISATVLPPNDPKKLLIRWVVPAGVATGLMVRELGLLRGDGALVARKVLANPIEKIAEMELGDWWDLDV